MTGRYVPIASGCLKNQHILNLVIGLIQVNLNQLIYIKVNNSQFKMQLAITTNQFNVRYNTVDLKYTMNDYLEVNCRKNTELIPLKIIPLKTNLTVILCKITRVY